MKHHHAQTPWFSVQMIRLLTINILSNEERQRWTVIPTLLLIRIRVRSEKRKPRKRGKGVALDGINLTSCDKVKTLASRPVTMWPKPYSVPWAGRVACTDIRICSQNPQPWESCRHLYCQCSTTATPHMVTVSQRRMNTESKQCEIQPFDFSRREHVSHFRDKIGLSKTEDVCKVLTNCMTHKVLCIGEPRYVFAGRGDSKKHPPGPEASLSPSETRVRK